MTAFENRSSGYRLTPKNLPLSAKDSVRDSTQRAGAAAGSQGAVWPSAETMRDISSLLRQNAKPDKSDAPVRRFRPRMSIEGNTFEESFELLCGTCSSERELAASWQSLLFAEYKSGPIAFWLYDKDAKQLPEFYSNRLSGFPQELIPDLAKSIGRMVANQGFLIVDAEEFCNFTTPAVANYFQANGLNLYGLRTKSGAQVSAVTLFLKDEPFVSEDIRVLSARMALFERHLDQLRRRDA